MKAIDDFGTELRDFLGMQVVVDATVPKGEIWVRQGRRIVKKIVGIGPGPSELTVELEEERLP